MARSLLIIAKPYDAEMIRKAIAESGYEITIADWDDRPGQFVEEEHPVAVVVSFRRGQAESDLLLSEIQKGEVGKRVPVLIISDASSSISTVAEARRLGADDLILRPLHADALLEALSALISPADPRKMRPEGIEPVEENAQMAEQVAPSESLEPPQMVQFEDESTEPVAPILSEAESSPAPAGDAAEAFPEKELKAQNILTPRSGSLGPGDLPMLLLRLFEEGFCGRLILTREDTLKEIFFDGGSPVFAKSNQIFDRMGDMLCREGKILWEHYVQSQDQLHVSGKRLGSVLVEKGWIKEAELFPLVRRHVSEIIYSLFTWTEGSYTLTNERPIADEKITLEVHPRELIAEGLRRKWPIDRLVGQVGDLETRLNLDRSHFIRLESLVLNPSEWKILQQFDGQHSLRNLLSLGIVNELVLYQLAFFAMIFASAQPVNNEQAKGLRETLLDATARSQAIDRQRIEAKYAQVVESDYFTLLGLPKDATSYEVQKAYRRMKQEFDPSAFSPELRNLYAQHLNEILEVIEEAHAALSNDRMRRAYQESIR